MAVNKNIKKLKQLSKNVFYTFLKNPKDILSLLRDFVFVYSKPRGKERTKLQNDK